MKVLSKIALITTILATAFTGCAIGDGYGYGCYGAVAYPIYTIAAPVYYVQPACPGYPYPTYYSGAPYNYYNPYNPPGSYAANSWGYPANGWNNGNRPRAGQYGPGPSRGYNAALQRQIRQDIFRGQNKSPGWR